MDSLFSNSDGDWHSHGGLLWQHCAPLQPNNQMCMKKNGKNETKECCCNPIVWGVLGAVLMVAAAHDDDDDECQPIIGTEQTVPPCND